MTIVIAVAMSVSMVNVVSLSATASMAATMAAKFAAAVSTTVVRGIAQEHGHCHALGCGRRHDKLRGDGHVPTTTALTFDDTATIAITTAMAMAITMVMTVIWAMVMTLAATRSMT